MSEFRNEHDPPFDDLADESLRQFAREFDAARPQLSAAALERVRQGMWAEVRRVERRRARLLVACGSLAAGLLVAVGALTFALRGGPQPRVEGPIADARDAPPKVEEHFRIALNWQPAAGVPAAPLVPLDEYRSLIGSE